MTAHLDAPTRIALPTCMCGLFAIGLCVVCGDALCGAHGQMFRERLHCQRDRIRIEDEEECASAAVFDDPVDDEPLEPSIPPPVVTLASPPPPKAAYSAPAEGFAIAQPTCAPAARRRGEATRHKYPEPKIPSRETPWDDFERSISWDGEWMLTTAYSGHTEACLSRDDWDDGWHHDCLCGEFVGDGIAPLRRL